MTYIGTREEKYIMQSFIGLIGSLCFAFSSWPQAYLSYKTKSAAGVKWSFLLLWLAGSLFSIIYAVALDKYVLLPNYFCSGTGAFVILWIKIRENKSQRKKNDWYNSGLRLDRLRMLFCIFHSSSCWRFQKRKNRGLKFGNGFITVLRILMQFIVCASRYYLAPVLQFFHFAGCRINNTQISLFSGKKIILCSIQMVSALV